ncbi:MAG: glycosyltransferase family 2 protein [Muribaculaceae bacterium]|nr:glycosyltransferase family 2 protein [Muribaculaceae bacterium]
MNKLVSIIIPTYSRPKNLCRAIDSVLSQTYSPIEIIVVDDNGLGTEYQVKTETLLRNYISNAKIKYLTHETNNNGSAARNTGVKASNGYYIGLMDDDDEFAPNKIEAQVKALEVARERDPSYMGCYCNIRMSGYGNLTMLTSGIEGNVIEELLLGHIRFNSTTLLLTKEAYHNLKGFDERFWRHQDWEFCVRFFDKYKMALACPGEGLVIKHKTPNYVSKNPTKSYNLRKFFIEEMQPYIDKMPKSKEIYRHQYYNLSMAKAEQHDFKGFVRSLKDINKYGKISIRELYNLLKHYISRSVLH